MPAHPKGISAILEKWKKKKKSLIDFTQIQCTKTDYLEYFKIQHFIVLLLSEPQNTFLQ